jgi:PKD repeat protein
MKKKHQQIIGGLVAIIVLTAIYASAVPVGSNVFADAGFDQTVDTNIAVQFDGFGSTGSALNYTWFFHDGDVGYGVSPLNSFENEGIYDVSLVVRDSNSYMDLDTVRIAVHNERPLANGGGDRVVVEDEEVHFDASGTSDTPNDVPTLTYHWDFGDGTSAEGIAHDHSYPYAGLYNVILTVTDNDNAVGRDVIRVTVNNIPPVAEAGDDKEVFEDDIVFFDSLGTYDTQSDIGSLEYSWDFGDGSLGYGITASHIYTRKGVYVATLTVTDNNGVSDSDVAEVTVHNVVPRATADIILEPPILGEGTVGEGYTALFDASASTDTPSDKPLLDYDWSFVADGINPTYKWPDDCFDKVILHVTDDDNAQSEDTINITVINLAPMASVNDAYQLVDITLRVAGEKWHDVKLSAFQGTSTDQVLEVFRTPGSPDEQSATAEEVRIGIAENSALEVYYTPEDDPINGQPNGATPVWVKIGFEDSTLIEFHHTFNVQKPDEWTWRIELNKHLVGHPIHFEASVFDYGADDISLTWDFGDGTVISKFFPNNGGYPVELTDSVVHTYTQYTDPIFLILTAEDDDNGQGMDLVIITHTDILSADNVAPKAFAGTDIEVHEDEEIQFKGKAEDTSSDVLNLVYFWDFGIAFTGYSGQIGLDATHSYERSGRYTASFYAIDDTYDSGLDGIEVIVKNTPPVADFQYSPSLIMEGTTVTFNATKSEDTPSDRPILSYAWDFGDGSKGSGEISSHSYPNEGTYDISLIVTDDNGEWDEEIISIEVKNAPPNSVLPNKDREYRVDEDELILFNGMAEDTAPDLPILNYTWNLGDGSFRYGNSPTHSYSHEGVYFGNLTTEDNNDANSQVNFTIQVSDPSPTIVDLPDYVLYGLPTAMNFEATAFDTPSHQSSLIYDWEFGDGAVSSGQVVSYTYASSGIYALSLRVTDKSGNEQYSNATVSVIIDSDGDLLADEFEAQVGTNSMYPDSDSDGLVDYWEIFIIGSNPLLQNSDEDGWDDVTEMMLIGYGDIDEDGLTNPMDWDSDGDWIMDDIDPNPVHYNEPDNSLKDVDAIAVDNAIGVSVAVDYYDESEHKKPVIGPCDNPTEPYSTIMKFSVISASVKPFSATIKVMYDPATISTDERYLLMYYHDGYQWTIFKHVNYGEDTWRDNTYNYVWAKTSHFTDIAIADSTENDVDGDGFTDGEELDVAGYGIKEVTTLDDNTVAFTSPGEEILYIKLPVDKGALEEIQPNSHIDVTGGMEWSDDMRITFDQIYPGNYPTSIDVDNDNNAHIVWYTADSNLIPPISDCHYVKVNTAGTKNSPQSFGSVCARPKIAVDSMGFANIIWAESKNLNYIPITPQGLKLLPSDLEHAHGASNGGLDIEVSANDDVFIIYVHVLGGLKLLNFTRLDINRVEADKAIIHLGANDAHHNAHLATRKNANYAYVAHNTHVYDLGVYERVLADGTLVNYGEINTEGRDGNYSFIGGMDVSTTAPNLVHVVWTDMKDGHLEAYYRWLTEDGSPSSEVKLKDDIHDSNYPSVAVDSEGIANIVWADSDSRIHYARINSNMEFIENYGLSDVDNDASIVPYIAIGPDDNVHVTWRDFRNGDKSEVYYKVRTYPKDPWIDFGCDLSCGTIEWQPSGQFTDTETAMDWQEVNDTLNSIYTEWQHGSDVEIGIPFKVHTDSAGEFTFDPHLTIQAKVTNVLSWDDSDQDGVRDVAEQSFFLTDHLNPDTDGDGLWDGRNVVDSSGVFHFGELQFDADPNYVDTDMDRLLDGEDIIIDSSDPRFQAFIDESIIFEDLGGGLLKFLGELSFGTHPVKADTDEDGIYDWEEILVYDTDPLSEDTDNDGVIDYFDKMPTEDASIFWQDRHDLGLVNFNQTYHVFALKAVKADVYKPGAPFFCMLPIDDTADSTRSADATQPNVVQNINDLLDDSEQTFDYVALESSYNKYESSNWPAYTYGGCTIGGFTNAYRIEYEIPHYTYDVTIQNSRGQVTVRDGNGDIYYNIFNEIPIDVGIDQSLVIQFSLDETFDRGYYQDDSTYTIPAFTYSLYSYETDELEEYKLNKPFYTNLAVGSFLNEHAYQVEIKIPKEVAIDSNTFIPFNEMRSSVSLYMSPVWINSYMGERIRFALNATHMKAASITRSYSQGGYEVISKFSIDMDALKNSLPSDIASYVTGYYDFGPFQVYVYNMTTGEFDSNSLSSSDAIILIGPSNRDIITFREANISWGQPGEWHEEVIDGFGQATKTFRSSFRFANLYYRVKNLNQIYTYKVAPPGESWELSSNIIVHKVQKESGTPAFLVTKSILKRTVGIDPNTGKVSTVIESWNVEKKEILDNIDDSQILQTKYAAVKTGLKAVSVGSILVTDGREAVIAFMEGDYLKGTFYIAAAGTGTLGVAIGEIPLERIRVRGVLGKLKVGPIAMIAVGSIHALYNIIEASRTTDPIIKQGYIEDASTSLADGVIAASPHGLAIHVGWSIGITIMSYFFPNKLANKICSSIGSTITFLFQYFFTGDIPSDVAQDAYEQAAKMAIEFVDNMNENGEPAIAVLPPSP